MLINKIMKCIYLATSAVTAVATSQQNEERAITHFGFATEKKDKNEEKMMKNLFATKRDEEEKNL